MGTLTEIADDYVERMAALDPITATAWGVPGHEDRLPDMSPAGLAARADLQRATLNAIADAALDGDSDRIAAEVMTERLAASVESFDEGDSYRSLRVIHSAHGALRQSFDLMRMESEEDWQTVAARMRALPSALTQLQETLREGMERGIVCAQRQVSASATQCDAWGGLGGPSFFAGLVGRYPGGASAEDLGAAAQAAGAAYLSFGTWLRSDYLPRATPIDPVGRERYSRAARQFTGSVLDLEETYQWGWDELYRIEERMAAVSDEIVSGAGVHEAIAAVEADRDLVIDGVDEFRAWNQALIDETITSLNGVHFEIAEPIQRCEAMIAPPGGAAAMYYTGPSEDFSRPGRTWYPTLGKTRFPLWREVSICYHEGVPGHHLQVAQVRYLADRLNRFQRLAGFTSGHGEGWALYAERLMDELGYFEKPAFVLGMLSAQAMRAVRVVVDIGMHLELRIPDGERYHGGEQWTPELALPFVIERSCFPADFMASEVDRYLGLPGQAISYKVGERVWLDSRGKARRRKGDAFDLRAFHKYALDLGGMGLDQLRRELARF